MLKSVNFTAGMVKTNLSTTNLNMIKLKSPAEWQGIFYVGQDRTATERNYVAEATRRRRRILQAGFFLVCTDSMIVVCSVLCNS